MSVRSIIIGRKRVLGYRAPATCGPWAECARKRTLRPGLACDASQPWSRVEEQCMTRTTRWSPLALIGAVAIVFSACNGAATPAPSSPAASAPGSVAPASQAASSAPYTGTSYPDTAIDCAKKPAGYTGEFSQIKAVDASTVEFDLCAPDVAFLAKLAFSTNGIQDSAWLDAHAKDKSYVKTTNGTGPYMLKEWIAGDHITLEANPNYWGTKAIA